MESDDSLWHSSLWPRKIDLVDVREGNMDKVSRGTPRGYLLLGLLLILMSVPFPALAEQRIALVIGNSAYAKVAQLPNPTRDAAAIESLLRSAGFELVLAQRDIGALAMRRSLRDFAERAREADVAVIFYAGHGIEVSGTNYLVPVDAALERDIDVEDEAIPLDRLTQILEPAKRLRLVILDACRENPFVGTMKRTIAGRSIGRGLAKVDVLSSDTLIAFAAKAGSPHWTEVERIAPTRARYFTTSLPRVSTCAWLSAGCAMRS
jgi:Caspase domain